VSDGVANEMKTIGAYGSLGGIGGLLVSVYCRLVEKTIEP
jgi:hypothetical protein